MAKRLTPYEKVDNFITKCHDTEVDKWNAGLPNNADEWERFIEYWDLIEEVEYLRKDNAELRMYNNKLKTEVEFKEKKYQEQKEILEILKESPFILENIFNNKGLKNQDKYNEHYFWGSITEDKVNKIKEWLEK